MKQVVISKIGLHLMFLLLPTMAWAQWAGPDKTFLSGQSVGMDIGEAPWEVGEYCYTWSEGLNAHIPQDQDIHQPVIRVFPTDTVEVYNVQRVGPWGVEEDQVVLRRVDTVTIVSVTPKKSCYTYGKDLSVSLEDFEIVTSPAEYKQFVRLISPRNGRLSSAPPIDLTQYMPNLFGGVGAYQEFIDRTTSSLNLLNYYRTQPEEQTVAIEFGFRGLAGVTVGSNKTVEILLVNPERTILEGHAGSTDWTFSPTEFVNVMKDMLDAEQMAKMVKKIVQNGFKPKNLFDAVLPCSIDIGVEVGVSDHNNPFSGSFFGFDREKPVRLCYNNQTDEAKYVEADEKSFGIGLDCDIPLLGVPYCASIDVIASFYIDLVIPPFKGFVSNYPENTSIREFYLDAHLDLGAQLSVLPIINVLALNAKVEGHDILRFFYRPGHGFQYTYTEGQFGIKFSVNLIFCTTFEKQLWESDLHAFDF